VKVLSVTILHPELGHHLNKMPLHFSLNQLKELRYWADGFRALAAQCIYIDTEKHRVLDVNTTSGDAVVSSIKRELGYNE
jgi:hypothetical protein